MQVAPTAGAADAADAGATAGAACLTEGGRGWRGGGTRAGANRARRDFPCSKTVRQPRAPAGTHAMRGMRREEPPGACASAHVLAIRAR